MLLALAEEVIPPLDEPALVLVVDHLQLIAQPVLANLPTQVETAHANTGLRAVNPFTQVETAHANAGLRAAAHHIQHVG